MKELQYFRPDSLQEALELLHTHAGDIKVLAGGTDLVVAMREKLVSPGYILDIKAIEELKEIAFSHTQTILVGTAAGSNEAVASAPAASSNGLSVGAAVCLNDLIRCAPVMEHFPLLADAAKTLANSLLRNRATLVGNLCNASPGGDMLCPSIVLEGHAEAASAGGVRRIPLKEFFTGVKKTVLQEDELVTKIDFPLIEGEGRYLRKSRIKGHDLAQIAVAAFLKNGGGLNIAVGAAGPVPIVVGGFETCAKTDLKHLKEQIIAKVAASIRPIGDQRASLEYRQAMAAYLTGRIVDELGLEAAS